MRMTGDSSLTDPLLSAENWIMIRVTQEELPPMEDGEEGLVATPVAPPIVAHDEPWYRNVSQLCAMLSNFSTSYNVVNISLVLPILSQVWEHSPTSEETAAVASSLLAGMMVGQVFGGALGDSFLGRLGALRLVMAIQIVASIASSLVNSYEGLAAWRFLLGVGAGGVYPLAAVLSAELKDSWVVLTFGTQGLGFGAVPVVALCLLYTVQSLSVVWRLLVACGAIPGLVLMMLQWLAFRKHSRRDLVPLHDEMEPPRDEGGQETDALSEGDSADIETFLDSNPELGSDDGFQESNPTARRHGFWNALRSEENIVSKMIGTAGTWFLFDVLFYGNTLFQPIVIEAAFGPRESTDAIHFLRQTAFDSFLLASIAMPGYVVAGLMLGRTTCGLEQTPRFVMLQGFAWMGTLYLSIGLFWHDLKRCPSLLVALYGLTFFFANYGPNTTTFILPSLVYSPECRSTLNGLSAAAGKLGAWTGATLFEPAADAWGDSVAMLLCAGVAVVAFMLTQCFVRLPERGTPVA